MGNLSKLTCSIAGPVWLSANTRAVATRGVARQREASLSALCRDWPANPAQTAKAQGCRKLREDRRVPTVPNEVWAMDFLSDQLFDGRKIRVLTIVDAYSKVSPAIDVATVTPARMWWRH